MSGYHNNADYLSHLLESNKLCDVTSAMSEALFKYHREVEKFDYIACSGLSGIIVASPAAIRLDKRLIIVRKGEHCHSSFSVEGMPCDEIPNNYVIVDDLISTGKTVRNIINEIRGARKEPSNCVGIFLHYQFGATNGTSPIQIFDKEYVAKFYT